jgi:hypothetical protein
VCPAPGVAVTAGIRQRPHNRNPLGSRLLRKSRVDVGADDAAIRAKLGGKPTRDQFGPAADFETVPPLIAGEVHRHSWAAGRLRGPTHHGVEVDAAKIIGRQNGLAFLKRRTSSLSFASKFVRSRMCHPMTTPAATPTSLMSCSAGRASSVISRCAGAYVVEMPEAFLQSLHPLH